MKWTGMRRSGNIQDRRGSGGIGRGFGGGGFGGGGLPRVPLTGGGIVVLLIVVAITVFAGDPLNLLGGGSRGLTGSGSPDPAQATAADMTSVILASTEDVWRDLLGQRGMTYQEPTLVLFDYQVDSACGYASSAVGPFYCPRDRTAYLDLTFFDELSQRFGAPGDFAQAYVVAHEIGHHVQNLLGVADDVSQAQQRLSEGQANALSVRLELQADFYAGVWAHHAHERNQLLEPGDLEEALGAATAIGDDRLQRQAQGHVVPDSFTHGTSEQRVAWFKKGFESGRLEEGDTFAARDLARP